MVEQVESVAVIGTGAMGKRMVGHLEDGGFDVTAHDTSEAALSDASDRGAKTMSSPGEAAAAADLSLIVVGTYEQVEAVLFDEDGIAHAVKEGHIVAISSTLAPEDCISFAEVLQGEGIEVIDVPTCRGEQAAEEGDLLVLGGGPEEAFEKAVPVLQQFAAPENVVRFGEVGTGQVAKTANNTLLWTTLVADYEVLRLARAYGLNLEQLRDVLERSSGDNWTLREWDWIYGKWAHKDMKITLEMADQQELSLPLSALTWQLVRDITEEDLNELR